MSLILDLPPEVETELATEAARLGLPLAEYARRLLMGSRGMENPPKTGTGLVAYWRNEGLIGGRPDIHDSQEHARGIRSRAERRAQG